MTVSDFIEETSKIERFYSTEGKSRELTTEEKKIWYDELKNIDITRYRLIVKQVFRECKFMPKLADIINIQRELPYINKSKIEDKQVKCNKCEGLGFILYKKIVQNGEKQLEYEYIAHCNCQNGIKYAYDGANISDTQHRSKYYIPNAQEIMI